MAEYERYDNDSTDSNFHENEYDMQDDDDVDDVFEVYVDLGIERDMGECDGTSFGVDGGLGVGLGALVVVGSSVGEVGGHGVDGFEYEKSKFLYSTHDFDYDSVSTRWIEFNANTNMGNPQLHKGIMFSNREVSKEAIRQYERCWS